MSLQTVAFIGTGIMGKPMARNLLHAGYPVRAWNRSAAKAEELSAQGAEVFATPAEAAEGAQVLICMLSDGPTCDEVLFGENGAAKALAPGALVVVMSSIPVDTAVEHARLSAELGLRYLDAPVSGGERGA
ncbi:MAG TPA: 2-hydroxy-3-oxopropionate reductase, partial [Pseudomonas sp.]